MTAPLAGDVRIRSRSQTPIYDGVRIFLGRKDLVVSFYTQRCQFGCTYCALPQRSAEAPVAASDLDIQIDDLFVRHRAERAEFQQLSFGNEGSALDPRRFYPESLRRLLDRAKLLTRLEVLSIETRPEYITRASLEDIRARTHASTVDVTVGFETQNDEIRVEQLGKTISRKLMENRIGLLGELGARLTSYVMVKPAPRMTEDEGVREAIATIEYLAEQCAKRDVDLVVYLTPTYVAVGSQLQRTSRPGHYLPPTIQTIYRVIVGGRRLGVPVYTGLWSEGLAEDGRDFRGREGYDLGMRSAIVRFNKTNDFSHLEPYLHLADGARGSGPVERPARSTASG